MATIVTHSEHYSAIADAIRAKTGGAETYTPAEMAGAISDLETGGNNTLKQYFDIKRDASNFFRYYSEYANHKAQNFDFLEYDDTENVTDMSSAFLGQDVITTIPLINTINVTMFKNMFDGCSSLVSCPALNCAYATDPFALRFMFYDCSSLKIVQITNIKSNLDLSAATSLMNISTVISNLVDVGQTKTLTVSNQVSILAEDVATAAAKGWTINQV